jgi:hypothetical protein
VLDVDRFVEEGYLHLPGAVAPDVVDTVRRFAEDLVVHDGSYWQLGQITVYDLPALVDAVSPAVREAFDAVLGRGRWFVDANWGFPTRFPGPLEEVWHIDGDWFTHHLSSSEQVLVTIFLWQDVGEDDSPTLLQPGSHRQVAQLIADAEPRGIPGDEVLATVSAAIDGTGSVAATGTAGDVYVCHPFLAHSLNPVGPKARRVISNACIHHWGPLPFREGDLNAVERAIATR